MNLLGIIKAVLVGPGHDKTTAPSPTDTSAPSVACDDTLDTSNPFVIREMTRSVGDVSDDDDEFDLASYREYARTDRFLDWYYARAKDVIGITGGAIWARYRWVYCVEKKLRPISRRKLEKDLQKHCDKRRPMINGKRVTVYDIKARPRIVRLAA